MIKIDDYITSEQINLIKRKIQQQMREYHAYMESSVCKLLFADIYAPYRKHNSATHALYSAFANLKEFAGLKIKDFEYGIGYKMPELYNDKIILHILSNQADFQATYLKDFYKMNKEIAMKKQIFSHIVFTMKANKLNQLELCVPDERGKAIYRQILFEEQQLRVISA